MKTYEEHRSIALYTVSDIEIAKQINRQSQFAKETILAEMKEDNVDPKDYEWMFHKLKTKGTAYILKVTAEKRQTAETEMTDDGEAVSVDILYNKKSSFSMKERTDLIETDVDRSVQIIPWQYSIEMQERDIAFWVDQGLDKQRPDIFKRMQDTLEAYKKDSAKGFYEEKQHPKDLTDKELEGLKRFIQQDNIIPLNHNTLHFGEEYTPEGFNVMRSMVYYSVMKDPSGNEVGEREYISKQEYLKYTKK